MMNPPLPQLTIDIFASCNPHWTRKLGKRPVKAGIWYGERRDGWPAQEEVTPLHHVFPTVSSDVPGLGLMVGISAESAPEGAPWQLSDAFGKMGFEGKDSPLHMLLSAVEAAWEAVYSTYLPIRWLTPLQFRLITPIHLDLLDGESLRVPLLVALLRTACSPNDPEKMPWGAGPVFCTGAIDEGQFHYVTDVEAKLQGFICEFGTGRVALLTDTQWAELPEALREQVDPVLANNLAELLALPPMRAGLSALVNTPPELDRHLALMESKDRQQHFGAVGQLIRWMNGHVTEAQKYYFIQLRLKEAALNGHRGKLDKARPHVEQAANLADAAADQIGIDLHLACLTRGASIYFDMGQPEIALGPLEALRTELRHASPRERAAYWGTLCQQYRAVGRNDEAVDAGERAVKWARFGCVNELYRDLNYLAHAHIARARVSEAHRTVDLDQAGEYLNQSEGPEGPPLGSRSQQTNQLFCEHLRLEIARIQGTPGDCQVDLSKKTYAIWEHPVLFSLLSLVRNPAVADRAGLGDRLLTVSQKFVPKDTESGSIFRLFNAVYRLYVDAVVHPGMGGSIAELRTVLDDLARKGADGWRERLVPLLDEIEKAPQNLDLLEALCDAVYYH